MQAFHRSVVMRGMAGGMKAGVVGGILGFGIASATPALAADAEIVAWGYNGSGQTNAPTGAFRAVAVGGHFFTGYSLGIRPNGSIVGWGSQAFGIVGGIPAGNFIDVAACIAGACGLRADGSLVWWGTNEWGMANVPVGTFTDVDGGLNNFAARRIDSTWVVWGYDAQGQVANAPAAPLQELKVGPYYSLARAVSGEVLLWGNPPEGVAAVPKSARTSLWPAHVHAAALRADGTAVCWGRNVDGECNAPTGPFRQIAAGGEYRGFTVGLRPDGTLESWGYNGNGERTVPTTRVDQVVVGIYHGIGLVADQCPGDITNNGIVDAIDLAAILTSWGTSGGGEFDADANRDGLVDAQDLALVLGSWGSCPS
ncbi:MAG: dockerin type I domain-containing protein [bacterium]